MIHSCPSPHQMSLLNVHAWIHVKPVTAHSPICLFCLFSFFPHRPPLSWTGRAASTSSSSTALTTPERRNVLPLAGARPSTPYVAKASTARSRRPPRPSRGPPLRSADAARADRSGSSRGRSRVPQREEIVRPGDLEHGEALHAWVGTCQRRTPPVSSNSVSSA